MPAIARREGDVEAVRRRQHAAECEHLSLPQILSAGPVAANRAMNGLMRDVFKLVWSGLLSSKSFQGKLR